MDRRAATVAVLGVVIVLVSILADEIGIGDEPGFGWKQGIGVGVGAGLVLIGLALFLAQRGDGGPGSEGGEARTPRVDPEEEPSPPPEEPSPPPGGALPPEDPGRASGGEPPKDPSA